MTRKGFFSPGPLSVLRSFEFTLHPEHVCKGNRCLGVQGECPNLIERNTLYDDGDPVTGHYCEMASPDPGRAQVWGYTGALSYAPGDAVTLHVMSSAATARVVIARDDWWRKWPGRAKLRQGSARCRMIVR